MSETEKMTQGKIIAKQGSVNMTRNIAEQRDMISTMPNDIIGNVLSRLTMKEAVRTSVLATKWRYQWTSFSGVLDFDNSLRTYLLRREHVGLLTRCKVFVSEWEGFLTRLEHVMESLTSPSMQGLRVFMDLGTPWKVSELVKYAAEKKVRVLDLDFSYHFTEPFFVISETIRNVLSKSFEIKSLCVLRLVSVDVTSEVIEGFLASCPLLETLCVIDSKYLVRLKVCGRALKLKHLELVGDHILDVGICAENLMTLRYSGKYGRLNFESVPSLVEVNFGGRYGGNLQSNLEDVDFYEVLLQIHVLKLELTPFHQRIFEGLPVFGNVRQLELEIHHECGEELHIPVSLLSAFPSIRVLKIKFRRSNLRNADKEWKATLNHEFPNLRELEVSGFRRDPSQIEFLTSIFAKAPNLNRVVVDPLSAFYVDRSHDVKARIRNIRRESTIWLADALKPLVPPLTELIVL